MNAWRQRPSNGNASSAAPAAASSTAAALPPVQSAVETNQQLQAEDQQQQQQQVVPLEEWRDSKPETAHAPTSGGAGSLAGAGSASGASAAAPLPAQAVLRRDASSAFCRHADGRSFDVFETASDCDSVFRCFQLSCDPGGDVAMQREFCAAQAERYRHWKDRRTAMSEGTRSISSVDRYAAWVRDMSHSGGSPEVALLALQWDVRVHVFSRVGAGVMQHRLTDHCAATRPLVLLYRSGDHYDLCAVRQGAQEGEPWLFQLGDDEPLGRLALDHCLAVCTAKAAKESSRLSHQLAQEQEDRRQLTTSQRNSNRNISTTRPITWLVQNPPCSCRVR